MTTRVYRYEVPVDDQAHTLYVLGPVLHVDCRDPRVVEFWAESTEGLEGPERQFIVVGTGHPVPPRALYVGTALSPGVLSAPRGVLVWHLYEVTE